MNEEITKNSEIKINVGLNANDLPLRMHWLAEDSNKETQEASAFLLSIWDKKEKNTLKIDLWTNEMTVEEMKQFMHQTLLTMADSFEKSTGEHLMAEDLRDYCFHFANKMNILPTE